MLDKAQLSGKSVLAAASEFLAKRYPELWGKELTGLQLGSSWLIETEPTTPGGDEQPYKVVLMINRYGWVEEVGPWLHARPCSAAWSACRRRPSARPAPRR